MFLKTNQLFDGTNFHHGTRYIEIENKKIKSISDQPPVNQEIINFSNCIVSPGWIDMHINGGGGVLFNNDPSIEGVNTIIKTHAKYGTSGITPTLITDKFSVTKKCMSVVSEMIKQAIPGIIGIHLEGPFLDIVHRGTHNPKLIQKPSDKKIDDYVELAKENLGVKIITVAPEKFTPQQLSKLKKANYLIMAGHTAASYEELTEREASIDGFTHFYNGMGKMSARTPNTIAYVLTNAKKSAFLSLIIDGKHIHPQMLKLLFANYPHNKVMLITDAMAILGTNKKSFNLQGKKIIKKNHVLVDKNNVISGTDISMIDAVNELFSLSVEIEFNSSSSKVEEILRMVSLYPAQFLKMDHQKSKIKLGRIEKNYQANLTIIKQNRKSPKTQFEVVATMASGKWLYQSC